MLQKFCMVWHGITPLKTWFLHMQTITEKIMLTGFLIISEIKYFNFKNENFEKKHNSYKKAPT